MKTDTENFCIFAVSNMAIVAQLVRVPDCGSVGRRFESDLSPKVIQKQQELSCCFFLGRYSNLIYDFKDIVQLGHLEDLFHITVDLTEIHLTTFSHRFFTDFYKNT